MILKKLVMIFIILLLVPCVIADLNWKDTMKVGQARLYQQNNQAYTVELVYAQAGKARFWINHKELTGPIYARDEYETADGSTIQPLHINEDERGRVEVEYFFFASEVDMIETEDSHQYRSKIIDSTFDYDELYTKDEYEALMKGMRLEEEEKVVTRNITEVTERMVDAGSYEVEIVEDKQVFNIGWMNKFLNWIKGLFS